MLKLQIYHGHTHSTIYLITSSPADVFVLLISVFLSMLGIHGRICAGHYHVD